MAKREYQTPEIAVQELSVEQGFTATMTGLASSYEDGGSLDVSDNN